MSDRCPYCSDYESIKEELEETKRNAEKEVKNSLENCEAERKKIKKQLMVISLIIVVAGTLLGKEFVDKVTGYLESFNSIKDAGSELISESTPIPSKTNSKTWPSFSGKPRSVAQAGYYTPKPLNIQMYEVDKPLSYSNELTELIDLTVPYSLKVPVLPDQIIDYTYLDWSDYLTYEEPESLLSIDPFLFKDPLDIQFYTSPPIPGPGVLMSFAIGLLFIKRRKR